MKTIIMLHFQHKLPQDIDFFQHLEMHMHSELPSLVGRDHLSYRSYYLPVKVRCCVVALRVITFVCLFVFSASLMATCASNTTPWIRERRGP